MLTIVDVHIYTFNLSVLTRLSTSPPVGRDNLRDISKFYNSYSLFNKWLNTFMVLQVFGFLSIFSLIPCLSTLQL